MQAILYYILIFLSIRPACFHVTSSPYRITTEYWMQAKEPPDNKLCATLDYVKDLNLWTASVPHPTVHPRRIAETKLFNTRPEALTWINQHCRTIKDIQQ